MITRSLWLLLALILGFGVPFFAFGVANLDLISAVLLSVIGLLAAAWVVRHSSSSTRQD